MQNGFQKALTVKNFTPAELDTLWQSMRMGRTGEIQSCINQLIEWGQRWDPQEFAVAATIVLTHALKVKYDKTEAAIIAKVCWRQLEKELDIK
jgi:hypothetical protein